MINITVTEREKKMLMVLGALVGVVIIYYGIISPIRNLANGPDNSAQLEENVDALAQTYAAYSTTRDIRSRLERKLNNKNDTTAANISTWAERNNLSSSIAYTRRTQTNIQNKYVRTNTDIKINGAPIQSIIGFIHSIEQSDDLIYITSVSIKKGLKNRKTYDALITIHSYASK